MKIVFNPFNKYTDDIFAYEVAKRDFIGATWIPLLYKAIREKGLELILAQKYLLQGQFSAHDLIISEANAPLTQELFSTAAQPFVIFSGESPNIDWKFYTLLNKYTGAYKYAYLFSGCEPYIHKSAKFIPFYWPNDGYAALDNPSFFSQKKLKKLVMIAANKKQNSIEGMNILKRGLKTVTMNVVTNMVPSVKLKDLYTSRMEAIKYFSSKNFFDLYGRHWGNHSNLSHAERSAVKKLNPSEVQDKRQLLSQYQFALCFENCVYPGYVTEKIFDCFFSGCIPIYLGAPDIQEFVPENLFIDMRQFKDFNQLAFFIEAFTEEQRQQYLQRIAIYLKSAEFGKFTDAFFSSTLMQLIQNEIPRY